MYVYPDPKFLIYFFKVSKVQSQPINNLSNLNLKSVACEPGGQFDPHRAVVKMV